jgi:hypothetical protein
MVSLVVALSACPPVDSGGTSVAPVNECPARSCAAYEQASVVPVCSSGACVVAQNSADYTLVVSVPETALFAAGQTFITTYGRLATCAAKGSSSVLCRTLPVFGQYAGLYGADPRTQERVGFFLGTGTRSIPAEVTLRPAWSLDPAIVSPTTDANLVGFSLQPIFARRSVGGRLPAYDGPAPPGDTGSRAPVGFSANVPAGTYEVTIAPTPPFDAAFPPLIETATSALSGEPESLVETSRLLGAQAKDPKLQVVGVHQVNVARAGAPALGIDGWTLFLRDARAQRRISTVATVHAASTVRLFTVAQNEDGTPVTTVRSGVELVLHPSARAPRLPDLVLAAIGNTVPATALYPLLPPPVPVRGRVVGADGLAVRASIAFVATALAVLDDRKASDLQFSDDLDTADDGTFAGTFPPGKYDAILTPDPSSGVAKSVVDVEISVGGATPQTGLDLRVMRPAILRGTCRTADGRVLAGAEVEAHASAVLVAASDADRRRWPSTATTFTNDAGAYVLSNLQPSAIYDVVVRPASGTRFGWAVRPRVTVGAPESTTTLDITVNAPSLLDFVLLDPHTPPAPVQNALIRAYAPFCPGNPSDCAARPGVRVPVEVARARTERDGRIQLYLDPVPLDR